MINMLLANIFNSKIIDYQREGDWAGEMSTEARGMLTFVIAMREETFSEQLVCEDACLGKAPHSSMHFKIYKPILCVLVEIVLCLNP